ncbi:pyrroline-5-carboxylate reductase [Agrilactobacillus yilanensis]|uniref:Pyrroline-5-carboxylate reductase n=1 Tax=Agrilactobacillus yilanensis TaxID=2485997 RepID=A0ABW4JAI1_9LACO|nr:pyrroline-5-carboxylate reductase [Agrilactobacillus yilanensis]
MKIGFIGAGNMAQAMIEGLLTAKVPSSELLIHSAHPNHYEAYAQSKGIQAVASNLTLTQQADVIILAVEPALYETVITEIKPALTEEKILASVLTGISVAQLSTAAAISDLAIVRLMPNVNVKINQGMTAITGNAASQVTGLATVKGIFEKIGSVTELPEQHFSTFVALAGSSPAFIYLFIDSLARAGVKYGLSKAQATEIAAQAVKGSAQMVLEDGRSPFDLIDQVCSPGGTTVAGLLAMEENGFMTSVIKGIDATINKDRA